MADVSLVYPDEAAILAIGTSVADCTLPKEEWTHAAHFAACLWPLCCRPDLLAEQDMPDMIRAYNEATGGVNSDSVGYHETITQASIQATRAFLLRSADNDCLHQLHARLMRGPCKQRDWLLAYWSPDVLMGPAAQKTWVAPDLKPLSH